MPTAFEVWRQLYELYSPKTKTRSLAILSAIMGHPAFTGQRTLLEQIQGLERMADEYRKFTTLMRLTVRRSFWILELTHQHCL